MYVQIFILSSLSIISWQPISFVFKSVSRVFQNSRSEGGPATPYNLRCTNKFTEHGILTLEQNQAFLLSLVNQRTCQNPFLISLGLFFNNKLVKFYGYSHRSTIRQAILNIMSQLRAMNSSLPVDPLRFRDILTWFCLLN